MEQVLSVLRWIIHKLSLVVLGLLVWSFIPLLAASTNFTDSNQVKSWFVESGVYENIVKESAALVDSESSSNEIKEEVEGSAINTQELITSLQPAIPAEFIQTQVEGLLDGIYGWLRGETSQPEFNVSLVGQADKIEKLLAPEITRQLSKLPVCTSISQVNLEFDPTEATCIPPGYSVKTEAEKFAKEFVSKKDGPVQSKFTGDDLDIDDNTLLNAPAAFATIELLPTIFWTFLIGFVAITILTARRWQRGFKEVGLSLGVGGAVILFLSFLASRLASSPGKYFLESQDQDVKNVAARNILEPLAKAITVDVSQTAMIFSVIVLAIGLLCYAVGWHFGKSKDDTDEKPKEKVSKKDEVPELMRDDEGSDNFIHQVHDEKTQKPKIRDKIKKKLIQ